MGYYYRPGTQIRCFWPDDNDLEFYIDESASMSDILDQAKERFGDDIALEQIQISAEYIHTACLGYDLYDPSDYTRFLRISRIVAH